MQIGNRVVFNIQILCCNGCPKFLFYFIIFGGDWTGCIIPVSAGGGKATCICFTKQLIGVIMQ